MASSARSSRAEPAFARPDRARSARARPARPARDDGVDDGVAPRAAAAALASVDRALSDCLDRAGVASGADLCVGLSGGCDSTVLLDALVRLAPARGVRVRALHVHHGLSPNASRWARSARALCRRLSVPCTVARVTVDRDGGLGTEAAAREARRAALDRAAADWVVLGHHRDDQAETVLLQLLRGAGARGLAAMPEVHGARRWLRPLLALPREVIETCARARGLEWVCDESNADEAFDRNFLRARVLPLLGERFPGAQAALARSAHLLAEADAVVQAVGQADLGAARAGEVSVSVGTLRSLGGARARGALRAWLQEAGEPMPSQRRLAEALRQVLDAAPDAVVSVPLGARLLRRWRDRLWLLPARGGVTTMAGLVRPWNRRSRMRLDAAGVLAMRPAVGEGVCLRWLREHPLEVLCRAAAGDAMPRIAVGRPPRHRTLRNLWQEAAVPPWQRPGWPLLVHEGRLICVPGLAVAHEALAEPGTPGRVFEWQPA